jgi:hypothetical protein
MVIINLTSYCYTYYLIWYIVFIIDRMEKKVKSKQEYISTECEKTIQNMSRLTNELVSRQKKEM